ncbi:hypothetical protein TNCV_1772181 [Trichonephila clavipes]|nr:hypothetical protein TNCV_1772181 [Trichonephila clavipes]
MIVSVTENFKFGESRNVALLVKGLGSNPGEGIVCKCIVPLRHGGTQSSHRVAIPLVRLVKGEERWVGPQSVLLKWGGKSRIVTCLGLKATDNDRRTTRHDELRGP